MSAQYFVTLLSEFRVNSFPYLGGFLGLFLAVQHDTLLTLLSGLGCHLCGQIMTLIIPIDA